MIQCVMYKISIGLKIHEIHFEALSEYNAIDKAKDIYKQCGFIGRYYIETSNGKTYSINS